MARDRVIPIDGSRQLSCRVLGEGPPVVWVPGTGQSADIWSTFQLPAFKAHYTNIAVDLPGTGSSSAPLPPSTPRGMARDLAQLLQRLEVTSATFVGLSLGSAVVQELALMSEGLVSSAVLIGTWASTRRQQHMQRWFQSRKLAVEAAPLAVIRSQDFWGWSPWLIDEQPTRLAELEALRRHASASTSREALLAHYDADLAHDAEARLPEIDCPCLVIHGEDDRVALPEYNRRVHELLPNSRLVAIPRAGHLSILEQPESVNALIDAHLALAQHEGV